MLPKILNIFKSKKKKFQEEIRKEKNQMYLREKKKQNFYGNNKVRKSQQLHLHFNFEKKSIIVISLVGFFSALLGIIFVFKGPYFTIQNITISSTDSISNISIAYKSVDMIRGKNLFQITKDSLKNKIQNYQENIASVEINKIWPQSVEIILGSYPIILETTYNSRPYYISSNGIAIPKRKSIILEKEDQILNISIIEKKDSNIKLVDYKKILDPSTIEKISVLTKALQDNLIDFQITNTTFYKIEAELHITISNKTLLIFDINESINEQIKKLIVFSKQGSSLKKIYFDLRIPDKIFYCDYDQEYQCLKNLRIIYE